MKSENNFVGFFNGIDAWRRYQSQFQSEPNPAGRRY